MIRSGVERRLRRQGGGKSWEYRALGGLNWASVLCRDLSRIFTQPIYSRRAMKREGIDRSRRAYYRGIESMLPMLYRFSPAEPREESAPRSEIRETSAEVPGARAGIAGNEERKGLEGPSSAAGEPS